MDDPTANPSHSLESTENQHSLERANHDAPTHGATEADDSRGGAAEEELAPELPSAAAIFWLAVVFEGGLAAVAWLIAWAIGFPILGEGKLDATVAALLWGIAGTVPLVVMLLAINRYPLGPFADLKKIVDELIVPLFRGLGPLQFAIVAALAGLGEEILFRGLIQGWLADYLGTWMTAGVAGGIALVVASLLFGAMHPLTKTYALLCVAIGIYLGAIWMATGNLLVPIIIHGLYDFIALVYLVPRSDGTQAMESGARGE